MNSSKLAMALQDLRQLHQQLVAATHQALSLADQTQQATEHLLEQLFSTGLLPFPAT